MYPTTLPCPRLATASSNLNKAFKVTKFDLGTRSKRIPTEDYLFSWSSVYTREELQEFRNWYKTINFGVDTFDANWGYEGSSKSNIWQFVSPYNIKALGANNFLISTSIKNINEFKVECSLTVLDTLSCSDSLELCG